MPISIVTWIMMLTLVGLYILLNIVGDKKLKMLDRRLAVDRRQFTYAGHIPERRTGNDRRLSWNK